MSISTSRVTRFALFLLLALAWGLVAFQPVSAEITSGST
jgi:hypothetical protein